MSHLSEVFVRGEQVSAVDMLPGIQRKTLTYSDSMMVCEVRLAKGSAIPSHHHVHEQISTIVSGKLLYTVGDETRLVGPGDSVRLGPDVPHAIVTEEDALVIDVFSPLREDYL